MEFFNENVKNLYEDVPINTSKNVREKFFQNEILADQIYTAKSLIRNTNVRARAAAK